MYVSHTLIGEPPFNLWEFDIARFSPYQANLSYLSNRAKEALAGHYIIPWPRFEMKSGRNIKMTPFHARLDNAGASWGCVSGWERPNWFCGVGNSECVDKTLASSLLFVFLQTVEKIL